MKMLAYSSFTSAFASAADFLNVGFHTGAVRAPADKSDTWIGTACASGGILGGGYGIPFRRAGCSRACFFF